MTSLSGSLIFFLCMQQNNLWNKDIDTYFDQWIGQVHTHHGASCLNMEMIVLMGLFFNLFISNGRYGN